jgi:hypothetical protein
MQRIWYIYKNTSTSALWKNNCSLITDTLSANYRECRNTPLTTNFKDLNFPTGYSFSNRGIRFIIVYSGKVAGSIPDDVIGLYSWPNLSRSTMALRLTQSLTEMSTRNLPGGIGRPARGADNLTAIREPIVWKMLEPRRLTRLTHGQWMSYFRTKRSTFPGSTAVIATETCFIVTGLLVWGTFHHSLLCFYV